MLLAIIDTNHSKFSISRRRVQHWTDDQNKPVYKRTVKLLAPLTQNPVGPSYQLCPALQCILDIGSGSGIGGANNIAEFYLVPASALAVETAVQGVPYAS